MTSPHMLRELIAARRGQRALVEFLLECGANPVASGAPWATPLAWARRYGHEDIAGLLVAAGAAERSLG